MRETCATCTTNTEGMFCHTCRARAAAEVDEIGPLLHRLSTAAATAQACPAGDFVTGGAFGSRPPAALTVVALTAVTTDLVGAALTDPHPPEYGSLPLFVIGWAALWRTWWAHHTPSGVRVAPRGPQATRGSLLGFRPARALNPNIDPPPPDKSEPLKAKVAYLAARNRRHADPGNWQRTVGPDDPEHDAWVDRFGPSQHSRRVRIDLAYLQTWLSPALDREFEAMPRFVGGLHRLVVEARGALGDRPDAVRLGRCPTMGRVRGTDEERPCGATLWQDPYATRVVCPVCHTETLIGTLAEKLRLAGAIRRVWGQSAGEEVWKG